MVRHTPRKRFGQNFLIDSYIIAEIIRVINPHEQDRLVEIGPGLGALTKPLLETLNHLHVVELDRDIVKRLEQTFDQQSITIYSNDALKFDFSAIGSNLRVVGNLPYNISTPILFHLGQFAENIFDMHFMLQKEVVERMVSAPSTSDYGRLSVMLQYRFEMELMFIVPPESFNPIPKVESAIVRMQPIKQSLRIAKDEKLFAQVVTSAFSQRRKTLRNTLRNYFEPKDFVALEIDSGLRAENLSVAQYVAMANYLFAACSRTPHT